MTTLKYEIKKLLKKIFFHGISGVLPGALVRKSLTVENNNLIVNSKCYTLNRNCYIIGFGKAVYEMGIEAERMLGHHVQGGILSIPDNYDIKNNKTALTVIRGATNNLPDKNSVTASKMIVDLVAPLTEKDIILIMISGGGSALLSLPKPPLTLEEKQKIIIDLAAAGANIKELNSVRKRLSVLKGGGLVKFCKPSQTIALILSDIVGDPVDLIASGPTVFNTDPPEYALEIFKKFNLIPSTAVRDILKKDEKIETDLTYSETVVIGHNGIALQEASKIAGVIVTRTLQGCVTKITEIYAKFSALVINARKKNLSKRIFIENIIKEDIDISNIDDIVNEVYSDKEEMIFLFGGETTSVVVGTGKGGRNQELALRFSLEIDDVLNQFKKDCLIFFLAAGTDGQDGPTNAAGAITYRGQIEIAKSQELDPIHYLSNSDSYNYFSILNNGEDLICTGPTGTNVMDIHILYIKLIQ